MTPHFTARELTRSQYAERMGINNVPHSAQLAAMLKLAVNILEPVRRHFGRPVYVSSGFRSRELNAAIGGAVGSQHCLGEAADFEVAGVDNYEVIRWIAGHLKFDQAIAEYVKSSDPESGWIHCSYRGGDRNRHEVLSRDRTGYFEGLPR